MRTRNIFFAGGIILVLFVGGYFFFFSSQKITNYPSGGTDVIAFGDSLVEGVGSTGGGFVPLLSKKIGVPVINLGRSGETTDKGLARVGDVLAYHPKVVMVLFGGNDALQRLSREQTFKNLSEIISRIQSKGAIVVLLGVRGGLLSDAYSSDFKTLSKQYGVAYVSDVLSGIFTHPDLMFDGIHPNDKGYAMIADRIAPVILPLLK